MTPPPSLIKQSTSGQNEIKWQEVRAKYHVMLETMKRFTLELEQGSSNLYVVPDKSKVKLIH